LIAGLVGSQFSLLPLPLQAQTATPGIDGNCGFFRPFTKATTTWSGGTFSTWATAEGILYQWDGVYYVEVARQYSEKYGSSGTAVADAGVGGARGWFEGDTAHDFAHWSGARYYITGEFKC
jgi:hypothetical protein